MSEMVPREAAIVPRALQTDELTATMPAMLALRRSLNAVMDLVLPRGCACCDAHINADDGTFCRNCALGIAADAGQEYCRRCGSTAEPYLVAAGGCRQCRATPTPIEAMVRAGTYGGAIGTLVKRFKFAGQQRLDLTLGMLVAEAMRGHLPVDEFDGIVPVPADWGAWWRYRFHPAGLIADCAGRRLGIPVYPLVRTARKRRRQTGLPESQRARNIRGAFRPARGIRVAEATLCVIDDVSTTGATLREMGRVLRDAGAARVFAAVVAKTQLGVDDYHGPAGRE